MAVGSLLVLALIIGLVYWRHIVKNRDILIYAQEPLSAGAAIGRPPPRGVNALPDIEQGAGAEGDVGDPSDFAADDDAAPATRALVNELAALVDTA